jgi:GntR family transcriptional regulator
MKHTTNPKYLTISKEIVRKIEAGMIQPGDKIPSENELIESYNVSNTTARKSLQELELNGWATRIKGKGTFAINRSKDKLITRVLGSFNAIRESFNTNLVKEGFQPKNIILEKVILEEGVSSQINNRHYIIEGPLLKMHRLRYADDILLKDEIKYISLSLCPKINMLDLDEPLMKIYEETYNLVLENVERTLSNTIINPSDPDFYFENEIPIASFILDGAIICNEGKIVEIERSYYRGDKYKFAISTHAQPIPPSKKV